MSLSDFSDTSFDEEPPQYFDLTINGRTFDASVSDYDDSRKVFAVGKGDVSWKGCVVVTWYKNPKYTHAVLEWFGYNAACPKGAPDMDRGRSKSMLIGCLLAFKEVAGPHVETLWLQDMSSFKCPGSSVELSTMVASLFRTGKTYYQRLLNVSPLASSTSPSHLQDVLDKINDRVKGRSVERFLAMVRSRYDVQATLEKAMAARWTWRQTVNDMMDEHGCQFLEDLHDDLSRMFLMRGLERSMWEVPLTNLPTSVNGHRVTYALVPVPQTGGRSQLRYNIEKAALKYRRAFNKSRFHP
jgi:hypothetical protein